MSICEQLFDSPVVRALLWCLIADDDLSEEALLQSGFSEDETIALLSDEEGLVRGMQLRRSLAARFSVAKLAELCRSRLAEHLERAGKASEISAMLRTLRSLPVWLFPEWEVQEQASNLEELLHLANGQLGTQGMPAA
jgi:hypothetical protein